MIPFAAVLARQRSRIRGPDLAGALGGYVDHVDREVVPRAPRCLCGCGRRVRRKSRNGPVPVYALRDCITRARRRRELVARRAARGPCVCGCGRAIPKTAPLTRCYATNACRQRAYRIRHERP